MCVDRCVQEMGLYIKYRLSSKTHCTCTCSSFDHEAMHSRLPIDFTRYLRGGRGLVCT